MAQAAETTRQQQPQRHAARTVWRRARVLCRQVNIINFNKRYSSITRRVNQRFNSKCPSYRPRSRTSSMCWNRSHIYISILHFFIYGLLFEDFLCFFFLNLTLGMRLNRGDGLGRISCCYQNWEVTTTKISSVVVIFITTTIFILWII